MAGRAQDKVGSGHEPAATLAAEARVLAKRAATAVDGQTGRLSVCCGTASGGLRHGVKLGLRCAGDSQAALLTMWPKRRMAWCGRRPEGLRREKDGVRRWKTIAVAI